MISLIRSRLSNGRSAISVAHLASESPNSRWVAVPNEEHCILRKHLLKRAPSPSNKIINWDGIKAVNPRAWGQSPQRTPSFAIEPFRPFRSCR